VERRVTPRSQSLGRGGHGPWFDATGRVLSAARANPGVFRSRVVAGYYNRTLVVQIAHHPEHPGVDHLVIRHVFEGQEVKLPWTELQLVKDELAADGAERFAFELFPPAQLVVDHCPLRHLWVMPQAWRPPGDIGIHRSQAGWVPV
jgi:hypothetical protein